MTKRKPAEDKHNYFVWGWVLFGLGMTMHTILTVFNTILQDYKLIGKDQGYAQLRMNSGEIRIIRAECMATIGAVSNPDKANIKLGKAGRKRWLGKRPAVRGVAMNPVDHPHGGGEGRTSGGRHPVTPWGKGTKGNRTRSNKKTDRLIIRRRKR